MQRFRSRRARWLTVAAAGVAVTAISATGAVGAQKVVLGGEGKATDEG